MLDGALVSRHLRMSLEGYKQMLARWVKINKPILGKGNSAQRVGVR